MKFSFWADVALGGGIAGAGIAAGGALVYCVLKALKKIH
jgi:hypothetical protein